MNIDQPFRRKKSIIASYTSFSFQIFQERRISVPKLFRMIYNVRIIRLLRTGRATIIVRITENREEKLNRLELGWNISMAPERRLNLIRGTNGPETRILKGGEKKAAISIKYKAKKKKSLGNRITRTRAGRKRIPKADSYFSRSRGELAKPHAFTPEDR